ncbi:MAG: transglycosylase SLT domain-containing protein [Acidobacteria bacterium]|nr:transglycosylase SLT domain-containing protein [Acidobacteriota bacterium]
MFFVSMLATILASTVFESNVDRAFTAIQNNEWMSAASALDEALAADPAVFGANNLHYLRGRVAENQRDWTRSREEFKKIDRGNPLHSLAAWHAALASAQLHDDAAAEEFLNLLPQHFPAALKLQIARNSSMPLASKIYGGLATRDARYQRAKLLGDTSLFWTLIRENKDDDVALESARLVAATAATAGERMEVAETFAAHRDFDRAVPFYRAAAAEPAYAADARYQIARSHFLGENYRPALEEYRAIAKDFEGTDWQKDAEYQIASCYWRLGEYRNAETAYLNYIGKYGSRGMQEGAIRNLVDVYRVLGENQKALTWLDRTLAKRISTAMRQVLLFTKAKIFYTEKRYAAALAIFQQLGRSRLRSAAGGTTAEEVQYFQALCLLKTGNKAGAEAIWRRLARDEFSYYGQRSAEKLGRKPAPAQAACSPERGPALKSIEADLLSLRRPLRRETDPEADAVSELMFLRLWDEASYWSEQSGKRLQTRTAAQLAYLAGRYSRSISLADRLPQTASRLPLLYPAGFRQFVCQAAGLYNADPLWLHAIIWQESKYNPNARSSAAARGLMQFIPQTAGSVASAIGMADLTIEKLYDPSVSIQLGAQHWWSLLEKLRSPEMALAAYNGGFDNVQRW